MRLGGDFLKFVHQEGPQKAVYVQVKDLYHEFSNHYDGNMPDVVRFSFKFKPEFSLIENLYLRYTHSEIVSFFENAEYIPEYEEITAMSDESFERWRTKCTERIIDLQEEEGEKANIEISDLKYMLTEADIIRNHPDRLMFPSHEIFPDFVMG